MKNRKKKKQSIFLRLFIPLLLVVLMEAATLYAVLSGYGVFAELNKDSMRLLEESTKNKQQVLLASMINDWSNLMVTESVIGSIVQDELQVEGKGWEDIASDPALNARIVLRCTDELVLRLRSCKTTGIFMVLDGIAVEGKPETYAGLYLRDSDPYSTPNDRSDILMLRGLPMVSREEDLSLHSFWNTAFTFDGGAGNEENDFFFKPLRAAQTGKSTVCRYYGYWSPAFVFGKRGDQQVITYSIPLIAPNGFVYGVVGTEVNLAFINQCISNDRAGGRESCFYYLGIAQNDETAYQKVTSSGDRFGIEDFTAERDDLSGDHRFIVTKSDKGKTFYGSPQKLKLYNSNTPFLHDQWVLIGLEDQDSLFASSERTQKLIIISLCISVVLGCIIAIVTGDGIGRPIASLVQGVRGGGKSIGVSLPRSGVAEIDALAEAIELRNNEILESAKRSSMLIELSGLPAGVYEVNEELGRVYCSTGFLSLLNCDADEDNVTAQQIADALREAQKVPVDEDIYALTRDGKTRYIRLVRHDDGKGVIGAALDVTETILERRRIERERDYDALTGIWSRRAFENKLDYLFGDHRESIGIGALMMLDLDNLKFINDAYGHDCGDEYIRAFARALNECVTAHTFMARRSGDEFYLFLYGFSTRAEAEAEVRRIWDHLGGKTITLPDESVFKLRASGGVAWYPDNADMPNRLIHYADFAMYQVKHSQKGSIQAFDLEQYKENAFLFNGHDALNRLIDQQLIRFMFQPIFSADDGKLYGYEMLMRSNVAQLRTPDVILKMAKSQGKLHHIERITWSRSLAAAQEMREKALLPKDARLFINSIANQTLFREEEEEISAAYKDLLGQVVLEVTESEDNNMDYTKRKLSFIRRHNGMVAIDDFGTGYNSELALVMIPADIVKIDITLVRNVDTDEDKQMLIRNLISYARRRGIAVLAEGVETRAEMEMLVSFGVDYLQGYYLGRPDYTPATELPEAVKTALAACGK